MNDLSNVIYRLCRTGNITLNAESNAINLAEVLRNCHSKGMISDECWNTIQNVFEKDNNNLI